MMGSSLSTPAGTAAERGSHPNIGPLTSGHRRKPRGCGAYFIVPHRRPPVGNDT